MNNGLQKMDNGLEEAFLQSSNPHNVHFAKLILAKQQQQDQCDPLAKEIKELLDVQEKTAEQLLRLQHLCREIVPFHEKLAIISRELMTF